MALDEKLLQLSKRDLVRLVMQFKEKVIELEKRLLAYENAHTPSSRSRRERKPREPTGKPRGAPKGHEGTTRPVPEPNRVVDVGPMKKCSNCDAKLGSPSVFLNRILTDLPMIADLIVTLFRIPVCVCKKCGTKNVASHPDLPAKGQFGYNVIALVGMLKHKARLPYELVVEVLENIFKLKISPATALELDTKAATKLSGEYEKLKGTAAKKSALGPDDHPQVRALVEGLLRADDKAAAREALGDEVVREVVVNHYLRHAVANLQLVRAPEGVMGIGREAAQEHLSGPWQRMTERTGRR